MFGEKGDVVRFTKMHGLGNDFMVIDQRNCPGMLTEDQILSWSDRNLGVGFDQLLLLSPSDIPGVDLNFMIFNADGAEVAQCGNGARCAARYARDHGMVNRDQVVMKTHRCVMEAEVLENDRVRVKLAPPSINPVDLPFKAEWPRDLRGAYLPDGPADGFAFDVVSVGNPHAIIQVQDIERAPLVSVGPYLQQHPQFPESVNVNFVEHVSAELVKLRVYERGAGETRACGSGACATVVSLRHQGIVNDDVRVQMSLGELRIKWTGQFDDPIFMEGAGTYVFEGQLPW